MTIFYHGGRPGIQRGAFLLPPEITKAKSCSEFGAAGVHRRDRVYVTTVKTAAAMFASGVRRGVIYEVEPIGEIEPDPDCTLPGLSFQCQKARVIRVIKLNPADLEADRSILVGEEA